LRAIAFFSLWSILSGADARGLPAGALAVTAATWTSLKLLPPAAWHFSPAGAAHLVLRFLLQSAIAGTDVAWRALDPRLPLRPGFVSYPVHVPPGVARNTFCTLSSLLPGTLPTGSSQNDRLLIHCLDVGEPVVTQLAQEEALLIRAAGTALDHG
jgi:multicomponent Na+:H+ antiporter subunit E